MAGGQHKVLCEQVPNLRNYGSRRYKKHLGLAVIFSGISAVLWHHFVTAANQNKVREFYSNYDAEAAFIRMKERGLFNSVGPKDNP